LITIGGFVGCAAFAVHLFNATTASSMRGHAMRLIFSSALAIATVALAPVVFSAQGQEGARAVAGGGITAPGWTGKIDASEEKAGRVLKDAKLVQAGNVLHVTTGPAVTYWNPANKAAGNYTVKATLNETNYMSINDHPH